MTHTSPPPAAPHLVPVKVPVVIVHRAVTKPAPEPAAEPEEVTEPVEDKKEEVAEVKAPPLIDALRTQLANALVGYMNYKAAHWAAFGPLFHNAHLLFEDLAGGVYESIDELAERLRILGDDVGLVALGDFQSAATITSAKAGQSMREMIEQAHENEVVIIKGIREAVKLAETESDAGSVDLLGKLVRTHERAEWFTRVMLLKGDGLIG